MDKRSDRLLVLSPEARDCVVSGLTPGTRYEGQASIQCADALLSSDWTPGDYTVSLGRPSFLNQWSLEGHRLDPLRSSAVSGAVTNGSSFWTTEQRHCEQ